MAVFDPEGDPREKRREIYRRIDSDQTIENYTLPFPVQKADKQQQDDRTYRITPDGGYCTKQVHSHLVTDIIGIILNHQAEHQTGDRQHDPSVSFFDVWVNEHRKEQTHDLQHDRGENDIFTFQDTASFQLLLP